MSGYTYWDSVVDRLKEIERDWTPRSPGGGVITSEHRGMPGLSSGIITTTSDFGSKVIGGILHAGPAAYASYRDKVRRVHNVTQAINESFPAAYGEIEKRLGGISVASIEDVLYHMLRDVAITLGGSTALGAGIGGAAGAFAFGVGAAPGAAVGATAGFELGNLILAFTGLKAIVSFMKDAVPAAVTYYGKGFRGAWGSRDDEAPYASWAYRDFAMGHVLFFMAMLMGIVGYLMRGKGNFPILLNEIRASAKLGPKFADWIAANKDALIKNPSLQQGIRASAGAGAAESEAPAIASQGPIRGQNLANVVNPDAPLPTAAQTPTVARSPAATAPPSITGRAQSLYDQLPNKLKTKTVATDGTTNTISGYGASLPDGYTYVDPADVMQRSADIGHDLRQAGAMDQGVPGQYNASHAEKQSIVNNPDASQVDVSRNMCGDCQAYYQQEAIAQNRPITVSDPTTVRTFNPDGTVTSAPVNSGNAAPTVTPDSTPTDQ